MSADLRALWKKSNQKQHSTPRRHRPASSTGADAAADSLGLRGVGSVFTSKTMSNSPNCQPSVDSDSAVEDDHEDASAANSSASSNGDAGENWQQLHQTLNKTELNVGASTSVLREHSPVAAEEAESDEEDPSATYCFCQQPRSGRFMIGCDVCENWFHGDCVGVKEDVGVLMAKSSFVCPLCRHAHESQQQQQQQDDASSIDSNDHEEPHEAGPQPDASAAADDSEDEEDAEEAEEEAPRAKVVRLWRWPDSDTALQLDAPQPRWAGRSLQQLIVAARDNLKQLRCRGPKCDKLLYEPAQALFCGAGCVQRYAASVMAEVRAAKGLSTEVDESASAGSVNVALQMAFVHFVAKDGRYDVRAYPVARRMVASTRCLADYLASRQCEQVLLAPIRLELEARRRRLHVDDAGPAAGGHVAVSAPIADKPNVSVAPKIHVLPEQRASATALGALLAGDTTAQHGTGHVFDQLCRVCTGRQPAPAPKPVKKVYPRPRSPVAEEVLPEVPPEVVEEEPAQVEPKKRREEAIGAKLPLLWRGHLDCCIAEEHFRLQCRAYDVAGTTQYLSQDLDLLLKVHARIDRSEVDRHVASSLAHAAQGGRSEVVLVRLSPERDSRCAAEYLRLFKLLDKRRKCGAVKVEDRRSHIKDMYLYPLGSRAPIPSCFGFPPAAATSSAAGGSDDGAGRWPPGANFVGLEKRRPHLLLLVLVRYRGAPRHQESVSPLKPLAGGYLDSDAEEADDIDSPPSLGTLSPPLAAGGMSTAMDVDSAAEEASVMPPAVPYDPGASLHLPSYANGPGMQAAYGAAPPAQHDYLLPPPPPPPPPPLPPPAAAAPEDSSEDFYTATVDNESEADVESGATANIYQEDYTDWQEDPLPSESYQYQQSTPQPPPPKAAWREERPVGRAEPRLPSFDHYHQRQHHHYHPHGNTNNAVAAGSQFYERRAPHFYRPEPANRHRDRSAGGGAADRHHPNYRDRDWRRSGARPH